MTIIPSAGKISFAPQAARLGSGAFVMANHTWYPLLVQQAAPFGTIEGNEVMPLEIGGTLHPTGAFKSGQFFAATLQMFPRTAGDLGWLLYAALGNASSIVDTPESGIYEHIFRHDPSDATDVPWLAVRRYIPGSDEVGDYGYDCKITRMRLTIPAAGLIMAEVDLVGRVGSIGDPAAWAYEHDAEDYQSIPIGCKGFFKLPTLSSDELPVTAVTLDIMNNLTTPQEERIVGDYHPDDFVPRDRRVTIGMTYKWDTPDMYERILTGAVDGTDWTPTPFLTDKAGADYSFEARVESPADIATKSNPYALVVRGARTVWQTDGPPNFQAGRIVTIDYTGTVLEPESGEDYIHVVLYNLQTAYTWPS